MKSQHFHVTISALAVFLISTSPAWAVQAHGGSEGLVSHQIGHVLFVFGMGFLLFHLRFLQMKGEGWFEFKAFLWLIIAWNLLTFSGHWLHEVVSPEKFIQVGGEVSSFSMTSFSDAYFYLTRLDHLILVPALVFLLLALRKWRLQP
ncbi:MAG: hypothetical protein PHI06_02920 [Desulfobulbaceae bacterium]|nr:hypothetical protein [Desulfobulbaceae bacterium]